jgi:hypothetical protein
MKRLAIAFVLLVLPLGAACSSKKSEPTTPPGGGSAAVTANTGVTLEIGEMKLVDVGKNTALLVHADGTIEYEGQGGVRVTTDGTIVNDKGEVGFTLLADGAIKGPDGKVIDVTLSPEGVIKSGDKSISVKDDGTLEGANPDAPQMKIEGATTPGLKRTALFVLIALTTPDDAPPPAPTGAAPTK